MAKDKKAMIEAVMLETKNQAIAHNRVHDYDGGDLFFQLAFMPEDQLQQLCKKIGVKL